MVCEAMTASAAWRALPIDERRVLFTAALLHDVAKPHCTRRQADGRISSRGHSWRGAIIARQILWRMGTPFHLREQVTALVRHHLVPLYLADREDPVRLAREVSQTARCDLLALLAESDARGRICENLDQLLRNIDRFRELCQAENCLERPFQFARDEERFAYFQGQPPTRSTGQQAEVWLLSGLPGVGKDHWIENNTDWPVISINQIRAEMGVHPSEPQIPVLNAARQRARQLLAKGQSLVWNATNLSRQVRQDCIRLYAEYAARVRIIYLEVPPDRLFAQNRQRRNRVPVSVIERMMERWEVPDRTEAHQVDWLVSP